MSSRVGGKCDSISESDSLSLSLCLSLSLSLSPPSLSLSLSLSLSPPLSLSLSLSLSVSTYIYSTVGRRGSRAPPLNLFLISASIRNKMRRNRKSMLTDHPHVPRTPFGRLTPPSGDLGANTRTHLQCF